MQSSEQMHCQAKAFRLTGLHLRRNLVSYLRLLLEGSYLSAELQLAYSKTTADKAKYKTGDQFSFELRIKLIPHFLVTVDSILFYCTEILYLYCK